MRESKRSNCTLSLLVTQQKYHASKKKISRQATSSQSCSKAKGCRQATSSQTNRFQALICKGISQGLIIESCKNRKTSLPDGSDPRAAKRFFLLPFYPYPPHLSNPLLTQDSLVHKGVLCRGRRAELGQGRWIVI